MFEWFTSSFTSGFEYGLWLGMITTVWTEGRLGSTCSRRGNSSCTSKCIIVYSVFTVIFNDVRPNFPMYTVYSVFTVIFNNDRPNFPMYTVYSVFTVIFNDDRPNFPDSQAVLRIFKVWSDPNSV